MTHKLARSGRIVLPAPEVMGRTEETTMTTPLTCPWCESEFATSDPEPLDLTCPECSSCWGLAPDPLPALAEAA